jgi:3-isopropylmalate/(R)-2-methylmalate dehydratase small subunit
MEPFTQHTGRVVPLRRTNVDTDQIIPAVWLKQVSRAGFGKGLFAAWREDPSFVLNQPQYDGATILVAGTDFGTGSSREHAVWALTDYGFRVVIAPRFGDIFRSNATKAGLLPVVLPSAVVEELQDLAEADPSVLISVDLSDRCVRYGAGSAAGFEIDDYTRWRLMEGLDDIGLTLRHGEAITAFEGARPGWLPVTALSQNVRKRRAPGTGARRFGVAVRRRCSPGAPACRGTPPCWRPRDSGHTVTGQARW